MYTLYIYRFETLYMVRLFSCGIHMSKKLFSGMLELIVVMDGFEDGLTTCQASALVCT